MPGPDRGGPLIGLTVVRNEGDVIGHVLRHAARNHDLILVVDVCSWDDTVPEIGSRVELGPRSREVTDALFEFNRSIPFPAWEHGLGTSPDL